MASYPASESSDFRWKSLTQDIVSSEHLDEGARPVFSEQYVPISDDIQHFLPEYVRKKFHGRIEPNLCTIKVLSSSNNPESTDALITTPTLFRPFYTFILSWYKDQAHRDIDNSTLTPESKKSPISDNCRLLKYPLVSEMTSDLSFDKSHWIVCPFHCCVEPLSEQTRRCDGPCGRMRSVKELQVHGRCEHAICQLCTANASMIENTDGSIGCCNPECFAADLAALCPDPILRHKYFQMIINKNKADEVTMICHGRKDCNKKRLHRATISLSSPPTSSASKSNCNKHGLKELICIRALILEKGPMKTICRRHSISEIASTELLRNALQWVTGDRQNLHKSRIFFNYGRNIEDSELQEIDLKQYGNKEINYFPFTNGTLNFVVDYTNSIGGNSTSPRI
ncbi:hypothetical protein DINM_007330 [Dirofilaria immitis]|nr:hypothetical protein [Dirofilaria immitis]